MEEGCNIIYIVGLDEWVIFPSIAVTQVICGNKCDLQSQRVVSTQEGVAYANKIGWPFFETSAKLAININEAVHELIRR